MVDDSIDANVSSSIKRSRPELMEVYSSQLKHVPTSTTDLQLLSAEIRSYMASGDAGWYHTIGVLTFVGCWKHAWSVPGAVVLVSVTRSETILF